MANEPMAKQHGLKYHDVGSKYTEHVTLAEKAGCRLKWDNVGFIRSISAPAGIIKQRGYKDSFENPRVNAKFGSTALNPLPCCARRRWLKVLNHAGWQSSLKAHGRCPWQPGKTQGPGDDQERDGACKAMQNCWIAFGQQLTIKSRDVHARE